MPQLQEFVNAQSLLLFKLLNWNKDEFNIFKEPQDRLSPNWFKMNYFQGSFRWHHYRKYRNFFAFLNGDKEEEITGMTLLKDTTER